MSADGVSVVNLDRESDFLQSRFREKLLEHVFISELLQEVWLGERQTVEVLRSEVDSAGYDLVVDRRGAIRYIQLKSSRTDAKTDRQKINSRLAEKPGGRVIWLVFEECDRRIRLQYLVYPPDPEEKLDLGDKLARHTKANASGYKAERPSTRVISKSKFKKLGTTAELVRWLFG